MRITDGFGVQAALEPVGGDIFLESVECLAPEGRIVPLGAAGGQPASAPASLPACFM